MSKVLTREELIRDIDRICGFDYEEDEDYDTFATKRIQNLFISLIESQKKAAVEEYKNNPTL